MSFESLTYLGWSNLFWTLGGIAVFFIGLLLIVVILIQDSKEGGLGGAFGAGMGGESILGTRGQKEITRFTAVLGGILALLIVVLGVTGNPTRDRDLPGDEVTPTVAPENTDEDANKSSGEGAASGGKSQGGETSANPEGASTGGGTEDN